MVSTRVLHGLMKSRSDLGDYSPKNNHCQRASESNETVSLVNRSRLCPLHRRIIDCLLA